jgi:hypothetical protein
MSTCDASFPLSGFMASLLCDLSGPHPGLHHHDPLWGIWWWGCMLEEHGHAASAGERLTGVPVSPPLQEPGSPG